MKIKIITRHWWWDTTINPPQKRMDPNPQDWIYLWKNGTLYHKQWQKPCLNLEDCFKAIKGQFYGTNYMIVDMFPMEES